MAKRRPGISSTASVRKRPLRWNRSERVVERRIGMRSYRSANLRLFSSDERCSRRAQAASGFFAPRAIEALRFIQDPRHHLAPRLWIPG